MFEKLKKILRLKKNIPLSREVFDMHFNTPVGAHNRLDPNGEHIHRIEDRALSFIEIGPITPDPVSQHEAVPNKGARAVAQNLRKKRHKHLYIAANILKNPSTDLEEAEHDYEYCFSQLYDYADMFFVNLSQEDVPGVKQLQDISFLSEIVDKLINLRLYFNDYKPILIQVSSDLPKSDLDDIIHYIRSSGVDGLVSDNPDIVKYVRDKTSGRLPVVSKVPYKTNDEAIALLESGASLVVTKSQFTGLALQESLIRRFLAK